jgi:hypothetical protein
MYVLSSCSDRPRVPLARDPILNIVPELIEVWIALSPEKVEAQLEREKEIKPGMYIQLVSLAREQAQLLESNLRQ